MARGTASDVERFAAFDRVCDEMAGDSGGGNQRYRRSVEDRWSCDQNYRGLADRAREYGVAGSGHPLADSLRAAMSVNGGITALSNGPSYAHAARAPRVRPVDVDRASAFRITSPGDPLSDLVSSGEQCSGRRSAAPWDQMNHESELRRSSSETSLPTRREDCGYLCASYPGSRLMVVEERRCRSKEYLNGQSCGQALSSQNSDGSLSRESIVYDDEDYRRDVPEGPATELDSCSHGLLRVGDTAVEYSLFAYFPDTGNQNEHTTIVDGDASLGDSGYSATVIPIRNEGNETIQDAEQSQCEVLSKESVPSHTRASVRNEGASYRSLCPTNPDHENESTWNPERQQPRLNVSSPVQIKKNSLSVSSHLDNDYHSDVGAVVKCDASNGESISKDDASRRVASPLGYNNSNDYDLGHWRCHHITEYIAQHSVEQFGCPFLYEGFNIESQGNVIDHSQQRRSPSNHESIVRNLSIYQSQNRVEDTICEDQEADIPKLLICSCCGEQNGREFADGGSVDTVAVHPQNQTANGRSTPITVETYEQPLLENNRDKSQKSRGRHMCYNQEESRYDTQATEETALKQPNTSCNSRPGDAALLEEDCSCGSEDGESRESNSEGSFDRLLIYTGNEDSAAARQFLSDDYAARLPIPGSSTGDRFTSERNLRTSNRGYESGTLETISEEAHAREYPECDNRANIRHKNREEALHSSELSPRINDPFSASQRPLSYTSASFRSAACEPIGQSFDGLDGNCFRGHHFGGSSFGVATQSSSPQQVASGLGGRAETPRRESVESGEGRESVPGRDEDQGRERAPRSRRRLDFGATQFNTRRMRGAAIDLCGSPPLIQVDETISSVHPSPRPRSDHRRNGFIHGQEQASSGTNRSEGLTEDGWDTHQSSAGLVDCRAAGREIEQRDLASRLQTDLEQSKRELVDVQWTLHRRIIELTACEQNVACLQQQVGALKNALDELTRQTSDEKQLTDERMKQLKRDVASKTNLLEARSVHCDKLRCELEQEQKCRLEANAQRVLAEERCQAQGAETDRRVSRLGSELATARKQVVQLEQQVALERGRAEELHRAVTETKLRASKAEKEAEGRMTLLRVEVQEANERLSLLEGCIRESERIKKELEQEQHCRERMEDARRAADTTLRGKLQEAKTLISKQNALLTQWQARVAALERQLKDARNEAAQRVEDAKTDAARRVEETMAAVQQRVRDEAAAQESDLQRELEAERRRFGEIETHVADAYRCHDLLKEIVDRREAEASTQNAAIASLRRNLNDLALERDGLVTSRDDVSKQLEEARDQLDRVTRERDSSLAVVAELRQRIQEIDGELQGLRSSRDALMCAARADHDSLERVTHEHGALLRAQDGVDADLRTTRTQLERMGAERDALLATADGFRMELRSSDQQLHTLTHDLDSLQATANGLMEELGQTRQQLNRVISARDAQINATLELQGEVTRLNAELKCMRRDHNALLNMNCELKDRLRRADEQLNDVTKERDKALAGSAQRTSAVCAALQQEAQRLNASNDSHVATISGLRAQLGSCNDKLAQVSRERDALLDASKSRRTAVGRERRAGESPRATSPSTYAETLINCLRTQLDEAHARLRHVTCACDEQQARGDQLAERLHRAERVAAERREGAREKGLQGRAGAAEGSRDRMQDRREAVEGAREGVDDTRRLAVCATKQDAPLRLHTLVDQQAAQEERLLELLLKVERELVDLDTRRQPPGGTTSERWRRWHDPSYARRCDNSERDSYYGVYNEATLVRPSNGDKP